MLLLLGNIYIQHIKNRFHSLDFFFKEDFISVSREEGKEDNFFPLSKA